MREAQLCAGASLRKSSMAVLPAATVRDVLLLTPGYHGTRHLEYWKIRAIQMSKRTLFHTNVF